MVRVEPGELGGTILGDAEEQEGDAVTHELVGEEEDRLQAEFAVAKVEQVFQRRAPVKEHDLGGQPRRRIPRDPACRRHSQEIEDHGVVITLGPVPPDERNSDTTGQRLVHLALVFQLGVFRLDGFELDGDFFTRDDVDAEVDVTKGTGSDLFTDPVFGADAEIHGHDE